MVAKRKGRIGVIVLIAFTVLLAALATYRWTAEHKTKAVSLCFTWPIGLLTAVAEGRGFFTDEGLDVTLLPYAVGRDGFNDMLAGACDVATVAETPIVFKSFERRDFRIIATTSAAEDFHQMVARRDHGIVSFEDLKGKRIGVLRATSAHFFLYRILLENHIPMQQVKTVFVDEIDALTAALLRGDLDAVAIWQPNGTRLRAELGENAVVFAYPGLVLTTISLVTRERWVRERPEVIPPLLRALRRAKDFAASEPAAARATVAHVAGVSDADVNAAWHTRRQEVSLTQAFLLSLESEARWVSQSNAIPTHRLPDFRKLLYLDGLQNVAPQDVTVLR